MTVIADAGPLIHLSLLGKIDLLPSLYGRVLIPDLVYDEVAKAGTGRPGSTEVQGATWIDVEPHEPDADLFRLLRSELDPGEAAAIWLSLNRRAECLLSDDRQARLAAERLGLTVRGTLGILAESKRRGFLVEVSPLLRELQQQGVWLSEKLVEAVLKSLGEAGS
ncbi:MAG TPA: DUF3368 domain-containing protein [Thermoanaerobaculia bacterium]|nr:DUF3368 domain-containing protein [Thermoanaerobaculia bacterium]